MLPRLGSKLVSRWLVATLAVSIVAMVDGGWTIRWLSLSPERIWHGQVWRLFTWALIELGPYSVVITLASIYKFGGELAPRWGDRRLQRFMLQIVLGAAAITTLLGLVSDQAWHMYRSGGWVVSEVLVIAWARQYPNTPLQFFGFLTLNGQRIVGLTLGIVVLMGLAIGPFAAAPELVACFAAAFYPRGWLA